MRGRLTSWPAMKTASSIWAFLSLDIFLPLDLFFSYTVLSLFKDFEYSLEDCVLYYFVAAPSFVICVGPQHLLGKTVHSPWILGPKFLNGTSPGSALRPESCFSCYPTLKLPIVLACALRHIRLHALLIRILWVLLVTEDSPKDGGKNAFLQPLFHFVSGLRLMSSNSENEGQDFGDEMWGGFWCWKSRWTDSGGDWVYQCFIYIGK